MATAYTIKKEGDRSKTLSLLAPQLDIEKQIMVLQEALYTIEKSSLDMIFETWKKIEFTGLKENVIKFIKFTSPKKRENGISALGSLTPALVHFRGPAIADELYRTITDVTRWWP